MARLEHFLDAVLKQSLQEAMERRGRYMDLIAQCTQLRHLLAEMDALAPGSFSELLVNLGHHVYAAATVPRRDTLWVHIGCGVVVEMSREEALRHLGRREAVARAALDRQNRHVLRLKYRIRLVTEALRRLHERYTGTGRTDTSTR